MEKCDGYKEIVFNAIIGFNIIPAKSNKKLNVFKNLFFIFLDSFFNVKTIITHLVCGCLILSIFVTDIYAYGDNIGTSNYMDNETVLYRRGPNIVTSREVNQYRYEGYMHLDSTYKYGGRYIESVDG